MNEQLLSVLYLKQIWLYPEQRPFAVFDFTISEDLTNYFIAVAIDKNGEIISVDIES
ncbi:MAG: DUF2004 domain-containing protein [Bacteroidota bacterium]